MSFLLALAAASAPLPPPLDTAQAADIGCVALLAIVASEQKRGAGWSDYPPVGDSGAHYAGLIGEALVKGGRTREAVRDMMVAAVAARQKGGEPPRAEVDRCAALAAARAPASPRPGLPRCAAVMALAYDAVKARDGLTTDAKDLATLASVLAYRARAELTASGKSEAQADATIAAERDQAAKAGATSDDELRACAELAAPTPTPGSGH